MNRDNNNDIDTIIDRSFAIYQDNSNNLEKIFAILCGAGLIFFFAAILPYFFIQFERQRVSIEYDNTLSEINQTQSAIDDINIQLRRITQLRDEEIPKVDRELQEINASLSQIEAFPERVASTKENLSIQLQRLEVVNETLNNELSILESNKAANLNELNRLNITLLEQEKKENSLASELGDLTTQWESVQSPIGELPIGFRDLVAVFPFSLSAGFLIYVYLFSKTIAIRRFLHYLKKKKKKESLNNTEIDRDIAFTSPLWIDPINPEQNKVLSFLILIVPFVIFVASISMILYSWNAEEDSDPVLGEAYVMTYYVIDALGLGFFAYGYWHIINEIRQYFKKLDSWFLTSDQGKKRVSSNT